MKEALSKENKFLGVGERILNRQLNKLENALERTEGRITSEMDVLLERAVQELADEGTKATENDLLIKALEKLREKWGGLPDEANKRLIDFKERQAAEKIAEECGPGQENFYAVLGRYVVENKRQGIELDGKRIEGLILEILSGKKELEQE